MPTEHVSRKLSSFLSSVRKSKPFASVNLLLHAML